LDVTGRLVFAVNTVSVVDQIEEGFAIGIESGIDSEFGHENI
jgi:hypothetical protein